MRMMRLCWSCAVALAAVFTQGSWAASSNNQSPADARRLRSENSNPPNGVEAEMEGQVFVGVEVTTTIIVAYPKITEGPSIVRRKLGSNHWDIIHDGIQGKKRDATACPTDYQLCPASLNGGCCPTDRACGTSSCLPISTLASACGMAGYIACGVSDGGGCCPSNYACGTNGCTPSAGFSNTQTCGGNSYLCASSFNFGCCKSGMACALNGCYSTEVVSFTLTETLTTTDANAKATTITTTVTSSTIPGAPTSTSTVGSDGVIAKIPASAAPVPKTSASGTPSSGLTPPQIGGIIGGAVAILIIILIAAWLIIKRLNKAIEVTKAANSRGTSSGFRSGQSGLQPRPSYNPDIDAMSVDPLMMTPSEVSSSVRHPRHLSSSQNSSYDQAPTGPTYEVEANEAFSPPLFNSPFSPRSPPSSHYPGGYAAVANSETSSNRKISVDYSPPIQHNPIAGYFDITPSEHRQSLSSSLGWRPSIHGRNWSNASDQSVVSADSNPNTAVELEAEEGMSGLQRALQGMGIGGRKASQGGGRVRKNSWRKNSGEQGKVLTGGPMRAPAVLTGGPVRGGVAVGVGAGLGGIGLPAFSGLGHISEAGESKYNIDRGVSPGLLNVDLGGPLMVERERNRLVEGQEMVMKKRDEDDGDGARRMDK